MHGKDVSSQTMMEVLSCALFGGLLLWLVISGEYLSYVAPRIGPYLIFASVVMLSWALLGLGKLLRPQHRVRTAHCFVLALPMLLLLLPHTAVTTESLASGYTDMGTLVQNAGSSSSEDKTPSVTAEPSSPSGSGLSGLDETSREITISDDEFYQWISEIYSNMDKYEGYTVSVTGYVLKGTDYLGENEFVAARLAMTCCIADLTPVGMVCEYDGVAGLEANTWVTVRGVIAIGQYQGEDEPEILVTDIAPAEEVEGYIYPY